MLFYFQFLQGRVYVQTGKGLRLANVTFNNSPNTDHNKRLSIKPTPRQKRKSETSPSKNPIMSPTKEDEPRHSNESEDDFNTEIKTRKPFRANVSPKTKRRNRSTPKTISRKPKTPKDTPVRRIKPKTIIKKSDEEINKTGQTDPDVGQTDPDVGKTETAESENEVTEWDVKSPGHSIESMDTCEESSQDTIGPQNSDNDSDNDSIIEVESVSENSDDSEDNIDGENSAWTRHEDKIILQMFQENGDGEVMYKKIQQSLTNRTVNEIKQRFNVLMSLLKQMSDVSAT